MHCHMNVKKRIDADLYFDGLSALNNAVQFILLYISTIHK
jgi:hypothetical protein